MILYDIIWYYMILYDIIWYYMILYDIIWYYMILYDIICYIMLLFHAILDYSIDHVNPQLSISCCFIIRILLCASRCLMMLVFWTKDENMGQSVVTGGSWNLVATVISTYYQHVSQFHCAWQLFAVSMSSAMVSWWTYRLMHCFAGLSTILGRLGELVVPIWAVCIYVYINIIIIIIIYILYNTYDIYIWATAKI